MLVDRLTPLLARLIPIRGKIALALFVAGLGVTVAAFYRHDLVLAVAGLPLLAGGLGFLFIPLPFRR